jgi:hypothetical protein
MLKRLKRHPFPVVAHFDRVMAVSFALPAEVLRPLVPEPLEIDTWEGLGFVTAALVWTRGLRPAALPGFLGRDFFLGGYRVFVRARDHDGRRLRGLRILRSETDRHFMAFSGNLLTHYNYRTIRLEESPGRVRTTRPDGTVTLDLRYDSSAGAGLPEGSPFPDWRTARRFAGPMPFTFDLESPGRIVVIEGRRADWTPRPFRVESCRLSLFEEPPFHGATPVLANAFAVENIDYRWERGRLLSTP